MSEDLNKRIEELAEAIIDQVNRDAAHENAPVMLTTFVLLVEGNGVDPNGERVTRGQRTYEGSYSQVKGLLVDTLDDLRSQERWR